jgi:hypothetical protein
MREQRWRAGLHFTITNGSWSCDRHYGSVSGHARLTPPQKLAVRSALKAHLEPWAPALPSHTVNYNSKEVLDFLFVTGKFTLQDVQEALLCHDVGATIGRALEAICEAPAPVAVAPASLRVGDVIRSSTDLYVVCGFAGSDYLWQSDGDSARVFSAPYDPCREPLIGHVADMIAEGLGALLDTAVPSTCLSSTEIELGTVIRTDGGNGGLWVATGKSLVVGDYHWQTEDGYTATDKHRPEETIIGHVADMLAEGLQAVSAAPAVAPGAAYRDGLSRSEYARKKNPHMGDVTGLGPDTSSSDDCWRI